MATNFPTSIDALVNPIATDSLATVNHADQHTNANDAIEALEAKVGVNGSAVTSSLDYRVRNIDASSAIVSGSTSGDLVRITQTGSGNALVVEDSANPDGTPFVINASGYVGIGTATPYSPVSYGALTIDGSSGSIIAGRVAGTETFRIQSTATNTTLNSITALPILFSTNNTERMRIDSVGNVAIGATPLVGRSFTVGKSITGASSGYGIVGGGTVQSDVTGTVSQFLSAGNTAAAAFTLGNYAHFYAFGVTTPGAGSTITNQIGFLASSSTTGATNNRGFQGDIASGTGRFNLYMGGTAPNYLLGRLGVGVASTSYAMVQIINTTAADKGIVVRGAASQSGDLLDVQNSAATSQFKVGGNGNTLIGSGSSANDKNLTINKPITGGTIGYGTYAAQTIQSNVTDWAIAYTSNINTAAAAFNLSQLYHYHTFGVATPGAGSTITNQTGFLANSSLTGATYNYGFRGSVNTGANNNWNIYMDGNAPNYMAGRLGVGATLTSGAMAQVTNTTAADKAFVVKGAASQSGDFLDVQNSAGTSQFKVHYSGIIYTKESIEVGALGTGNRYAGIDLVGDDTYTDYGLRLLRGNTGVNAASQLIHRGTGTFQFTMLEAAPILFSTTNTERMRITSDGNILVGMTSTATSSAKTIHIGNGTAPTANPTSGGVLYVESGALKYRGSSGTVTTIANA